MPDDSNSTSIPVADTPVSPTPPSGTAPSTPPASSSKLKEQPSTTFPEPPNFPSRELSQVAENADAIAKEEGDEYWENFSREIELEKKILEMGGLEKIENGEVPIPENVAKEMGIKPVVGPQTPISKVTGFNIRGVSLTDDQLSSGLTKPTSTGFRWLVEWFIYQLLKAHFHIKQVKGMVIREQRGESRGERANT